MLEERAKQILKANEKLEQITGEVESRLGKIERLGLIEIENWAEKITDAVDVLMAVGPSGHIKNLIKLVYKCATNLDETTVGWKDINDIRDDCGYDLEDKFDGLNRSVETDPRRVLINNLVTKGYLVTNHYRDQYGEEMENELLDGMLKDTGFDLNFINKWQHIISPSEVLFILQVYSIVELSGAEFNTEPLTEDSQRNLRISTNPLD